MAKSQNKALLLIAVIGAVAVIIAALIPVIFSGNNKPVGATQNITTNTKVDTGGTFNNTTIQLQQKDSSKTDIKIDNVARDKIEKQNNYYPPPEKKERKARILNDDDIARIKTIPLDYNVVVFYPIVDREAFEYSAEIRNKLQALGYKITPMSYGTVSVGVNPRFELLIENDISKKATITIYSLPK